MIDHDAQPLVKPAVALLETASGKLGTGYLVRADRIATCHHVVSDLATGAEVECRFGDLREKRTAYVLDERDQASDAALLELRDPIPAEPLVLLHDIPDEFWIHGFPGFAGGVAVSLDGRLSDRDAIDQNGTRTFSMYSHSFEGNTTESLGGLSGSPVLFGKCVVGHMSSVLGSAQERKAPHLGYAFAVRAAGVARLLGEAVPAAPLPAPGRAARAIDHTIAITEILQELEASATPAEIERALTRDPAVPEPVKLFAAERLIGLGAPRAALQVLDPIKAERRTELEAFAWSLVGDNTRAAAVLKTLPSTGERSGLLGGTYKRRWFESGLPTWLVGAHDAYSTAYELTKDPYPGVNAAACSLWLKRSDEAHRIASQIIDALAAKKPRTAWEDASLAEAYVLAGRFDAARAQYQTAVLRQMTQPRAIAVMRRQVRRELAELGQPEGAFDDLFPLPKIAVFTGHRVDPDETRGQFPPSKIRAVTARIEAVLKERQLLVGYSSAASGGDLLFIQAMVGHGGEANVFLPFPAEDFVETSVGDDWRSEFERARAGQRTHVVVLSQTKPENADDAYRRCNDALQTAALERGALLDESPVLVAVISASSTRTVGGPADMVAAWERRTRGDVIRIDPNRC